MSYKYEIVESCIYLLQNYENGDLELYERTGGEKGNLKLQIHKDPTGNIAIGYGLDLIVHNEKELKSIFDKANQRSGDSFNYEKLNLFVKIDEYKSLSRDYQKENFINENQDLKLPSIEYANILFDIVAEDKFKIVKKILNANTNKDYYSELTKSEKSAIFSMSYNSGYGLFYCKVRKGKKEVIDFNQPYNCVKKLREYIDSKENDKEKALKARTRVWYEFRYNCSLEAWQKKKGGRGLGKRRYSEGDLFGLYDSSIKANEARWILDKLKDDHIKKQGMNKIENIALYYEKNIVSPYEVGKYRQVNDKVKGIREIIKELEEKANINPVEQIKKEIENEDRELDNVSESFLKKYDKRYGIVLDKERPIYNSIINIRKNRDVLIFPLIDRLVVQMEKKKEKERNEELYAKIEEFINRCKEELEKVINDFGGYEKESYKQDNNKDLKNLDLKKRLVEAFNPKPFNCPDTKKSLSFFKSFITEEDKKKEKAKREKEEKKKREEERKKRMAAEAKNKEKRKRKAKEREKEEKEKEKKREGWIIAYKDGKMKRMSRKEYYGV